MTRAGLLRHELEIQSAVETADPDGGTIKAWSTEEIVDANIVFLSGKELETARQMDARAQIRITIRAHDGLTPGQRFVSEGVVYYPLNNNNVRLLDHEMVLLATTNPEGAD